MAGYALNPDLIARLIFKMLPHRPPFKPIVDRTGWPFGKTDINVLTLAIAHDGAAFPILISMLDKRGNPDTGERVGIVNRYVKLSGAETVDCLPAGREFTGKHRINRLNRHGIRCYIRIRENFWVENPKNGKRFKAFRVFNALKRGGSRVLHPIYRVSGQLCYLSASKIIHGKIPELQIIIPFNRPEDARQYYKERWQIEAAFRALKSSGFNIEDSHLTDLRRIEKLFSIVTVAFARAYVAGVFVNENIEPIKILKHGKRAKSSCKYGLELIATALLNPIAILEIDIFKFLSCT
jgi:hypothetical protein